MGIDVDIDIDTDVLDFDPTPPRRRLLDLVPIFLLTFLRLRFGRPGPTPFEKWLISLIFVKSSLLILLENNDAKRDAPYSHFGVGAEPTEPPEGFN